MMTKKEAFFAGFVCDIGLAVLLLFVFEPDTPGKLVGAFCILTLHAIALSLAHFTGMCDFREALDEEVEKRLKDRDV